MKYIVAIIRPELLEAVQKVLVEEKVHLMTVSEDYGKGREHGVKEQFRGAEHETMPPKIKLEIAVNDDFAEATIDAITTAGKTGTIGDGKIFVLPLEQCVRISTGEAGTGAIG
ncbi:MAG: P-II family nitrogen regulator [Gemmataceae bacterium]